VGAGLEVWFLFMGAFEFRTPPPRCPSNRVKPKPRDFVFRHEADAGGRLGSC